LIHENTNGASEEMLTDFSFSVLVLFTCVGKSEFKLTWCTPSPPASASLVFLCTPLSLSCTSTVFSPLRCSRRCRTLILSLFCKEKEKHLHVDSRLQCNCTVRQYDCASCLSYASGKVCLQTWMATGAQYSSTFGCFH